MATMQPPRSIPDKQQRRRQTVRLPHTHTPFMYHIPWLSLVALLDLLPRFKMINAAKNSSMEKNVCLFVFASV